MTSSLHARRSPMQIMADGTIKQVNPFSGTEVWTVPGRGNRPLASTLPDPYPLPADANADTCAFCTDRLLETPPEKARLVATGSGGYDILTHVLPEELHDSQALFRRVPNLFEIVSYEYWEKNYGRTLTPAQQEWMDTYLAAPGGWAHVRSIVETKLRAAGRTDAEIAALGREDIVRAALPFFGGGHDIIIGRRHFVDGATTSSELASSGTLSVDEHREFIRFTIAAAEDLYASNRYAPYVAIFQNWLKPAGASFDHLHKQLVAIDERGGTAEEEIARLRANPNMYNEWAVDYAGYHNLIIAENAHAIVFAGFGHRYPALEVFSKSATPEPWKQTPEEVAAMSDLIHACHAAAGPHVPCNEEWHHKPIDLDLPMPWRVVIKWRVSTLAGFEGGTKVYLNTISPQDARDRMVSAMYRLRDEGTIAPDIRIATECSMERNCLKYNPLLQH
ncbi:DUF4921 domain-containing protein [Corynebacterium sp. 13CS0277]|uniref:DUF4921 family protein n=1 Tax=Corynebacterium sp. 13CS0277 TaxID=2071994 RepID=UPI000D02F50E|nr:DUF4921 family protein [Corynebacterium sp. 13CS0277]PRQ12525.1 DUF4921 domain-containing protein [Corynebacterium sp. 13CS0277]